MDKEHFKRLSNVLAELKAEPTALISDDDIKDFAIMIHEGFTTEGLKDIVTSATIKTEIMLNKLATVFFNAETKEMITKYVESNGHRTDVILKAEFEKEVKSEVLKFWCKKDKISMVFAMDGNVLCVVEEGREKPIYLFCKDATAMMALYSELTS